MKATLDNSEGPFLDTPLRQRTLVDDFGEPFLFSIYGTHLAGQAFVRNIGTRRTVALRWDEIIAEPVEEVKTIWDMPNLQALLRAPLGSPIELTREEANEIVSLAFGRRPDLPPGKELVEEVRELLGHSLIERLKDVEQQ
jgi:hypothetical protein